MSKHLTFFRMLNRGITPKSGLQPGMSGWKVIHSELPTHPNPPTSHFSPTNPSTTSHFSPSNPSTTSHFSHLEQQHFTEDKSVPNSVPIYKEKNTITEEADAFKYLDDTKTSSNESKDSAYISSSRGHIQSRRSQNNKVNTGTR